MRMKEPAGRSLNQRDYKTASRQVHLHTTHFPLPALWRGFPISWILLFVFIHYTIYTVFAALLYVRRSKRREINGKLFPIVSALYLFVVKSRMRHLKIWKFLFASLSISYLKAFDFFILNISEAWILKTNEPDSKLLCANIELEDEDRHITTHECSLCSKLFIYLQLQWNQI